MGVWGLAILGATTAGTSAAKTTSGSAAVSANLGAVAIALLSASLTAFAGYYAARARARTSREEIEARLHELERRLGDKRRDERAKACAAYMEADIRIVQRLMAGDLTGAAWHEWWVQEYSPASARLSLFCSDDVFEGTRTLVIETTKLLEAAKASADEDSPRFGETVMNLYEKELDRFRALRADLRLAMRADILEPGAHKVANAIEAPTSGSAAEAASTQNGKDASSRPESEGER